MIAQRVLASALLGAIAILPSSVRAQNLLVNPGIELVSEAFAGRNAVPPGWQMSEGPKVPELPQGTLALPGSSPSTLGPYEGDYNDSGAAAVPCPGNLCFAVNGLDYVMWRNNLGTAGPLENRYRERTVNVDEFDFTVWKLNYGKVNALSMAEPGNFGHLTLEGDWHMWFQPYNSNRSEDAGAIASNFAHLYQDVEDPSAAGKQFTMTGYALFEDHFPGGVDNLNAVVGGVPTGAPYTDGLPSPTDTFFALEFLNSSGDVLSGSVVKELKANGQPANTTWLQHTLVGVAPVGTTKVRVRASMINGVENPIPDNDPEVFKMSFFVDAFSLQVTGGGGGNAIVPEPTSAVLVGVALALWSVVRCRSSRR